MIGGDGEIDHEHVFFVETGEALAVFRTFLSGRSLHTADSGHAPRSLLLTEPDQAPPPRYFS